MTSAPMFFFTRASTDTMSGMIGMMLTLFQEQVAIGSKFYGPRQIGQLLSVLRYNEIAGFKTIAYSYFDWETYKTIVYGNRSLKKIDEILYRAANCDLLESLESIRSMKLVDLPPEDRNDASSLVVQGSYEDSNVTITPIKLRNHADMQEESKNNIHEEDITIQYAIQSKRQPGRVLNEKIKEFKIDYRKIGTLMRIGELQLEDGRVVKAQDIRDADIPPYIVFILDIIHPQQIVQLQENAQFKDFLQQSSHSDACIQAFVHMSQPHVVLSPEYQQFLQLFNQHKHILCNFQSQETDEHTLLHTQINLRSIQVSRELHKHFPQYICNPNKLYIEKLPKQMNFFGYYPFYDYTIFPYKQNSYAPVGSFDIKQVVKNLSIQEEVKPQLETLGKHIDYKDHRNLIFLGTGSMKPGKYRNVSCILINQPNCNILLDCGEGSWQQIIDHNIDITNKPLVIWISHVHSDHHLGALNLTHQYVKRSENHQVYLIVPTLMIPYLEYYNILFQQFGQARFLSTQQFENGVPFDQMKKQLICDFYSCRIRDGQLKSLEDNQVLEILEKMQKNKVELDILLNDTFGVQEFNPVQVEHCPQAYGVSLTFKDGYKLSYSGDTRPCENFVKCSKNSNLIIHEATFSDELKENAVNFMHSTIREAVEVALESNSQNLVLTHFSQRYAKSGITQIQVEVPKHRIPDKHTNEEYQEYLKKKTIYAVDHLGGPLDAYPHLVHVSQLIDKLFPIDD